MKGYRCDRCRDWMSGSVPQVEFLFEEYSAGTMPDTKQRTFQKKFDVCKSCAGYFENLLKHLLAEIGLKSE